VSSRAASNLPGGDLAAAVVFGASMSIEEIGLDLPESYAPDAAMNIVD
jgi:hypothetical protein